MMQVDKSIYEKLKPNLRKGDVTRIAKEHNVDKGTVTRVAKGEFENLEILQALVEAAEIGKKLRMALHDKIEAL
jgi:hypothetical protein